MAMKFNLEELNPGTWFDLGDDARICLRVSNKDLLSAINKKATKQKWDKRARQMVTETDDELSFEMLHDYCVVDWEGIEDENGKPIECAKENKVALLSKSPLFLQLVSDCLKQLNEEMEERREQAQKN